MFRHLIDGDLWMADALKVRYNETAHTMASYVRPWMSSLPSWVCWYSSMAVSAAKQCGAERRRPRRWTRCLASRYRPDSLNIRGWMCTCSHPDIKSCAAGNHRATRTPVCYGTKRRKGACPRTARRACSLPHRIWRTTARWCCQVHGSKNWSNQIQIGINTYIRETLFSGACQNRPKTNRKRVIQTIVVAYLPC